jgi:hypothetical protein
MPDHPSNGGKRIRMLNPIIPKIIIVRSFLSITGFEFVEGCNSSILKES